jgi:hypothetical protein
LSRLWRLFVVIKLLSLLSLSSDRTSSHHLWLSPLLANLDSSCHILELSSVLHRLAKVCIHSYLFTFLLLELFELYIYLLLILSLLEFIKKILQEIFEFFDLWNIED